MIKICAKKILVAMTAAATIGAASTSYAEEPIRIGGIYILSGSAATYGEFAQKGINLAVDEINGSGGILGRQVEMVYEDSQGKASVAIQAARKLVYSEGVDALVGLDSSGVAQGMVPTIPELQKPLIITHAATPDVTGKLCNALTYRISVNVAQNMKAAALVAAKLDATNWTTIGPDYAFGHQSWEFFGNYLKDIKPDVNLMSETNFPRFGAEDFTPFIDRVMDSDADGVLISVWGGDLVNFVRQANNRGFFEKDYELLFTVGAATEVLSALGDEMPEGVHLSTRYWYDAYDNDVNVHFVKAYIDAYGVPPSYNAEGAYAAIYAYKKAMEAAGTTDGPAVAKALSGMSMEAPNGTITFRKGDNQAMVSPNWGISGPMNSKYGIRTLTDLQIFDGEDVARSIEETGCSL
ncbi:amino acid/amide ABC transporter substrate-binding protein, HAAT family [Marinobacter antarcticus]|uniref:Amino acid/amide ABC transporter substrate-binding protein, HAAT family n=1 Tax=Marinobacter antarcticus TaxID=564117 RepID=A0A1M6S6H8_9GAMM|nr:ABC transporter substrate-binding protein [Marinobacter antarcticus]SHK40290.1 amino acid/amide ABC transporter substrate-binding protein, HAAT family [Marinobacter antarcticus]